MTTGSWSSGAATPSPGPIHAQKAWTGGNGGKKRTPQNYQMSLFSLRQKPTVEKNKYYPYVPPQYEYWSKWRHPSVQTAASHPALPNVDLSALADVAEKIRGHDFNSAVFAAEVSQTTLLIKNSALAFKQLISACFSFDPYKIMRAISGLPGNKNAAALDRALKARDIGAVVLAMRYGWLPLLQDVFEAVKALEKIRNDPNNQWTFRGKAFGTYSRDIRVSGGEFGVWVTFGQTIRYTVVLREKPSSFRVSGFANPAAVIWEKMPFSFLFDWWLPVGSFLSELGFFTGLQLTYTKVIFTKGEQSWSHYPEGLPFPPTGSQYSWYTQNGSYQWKQILMKREVGTSLNIPLPALKGFGEGLSTIHLQNAGALIVALFTGGSLPDRTLKKRKPRRPALPSKHWNNDLYRR